MNDREPVTGRRYLRASHTIGLAYAAMALILVPWVVYLGLALPSLHVSVHYDLTWVGFDLVLLSALTRTAYLALRRRSLIALSATATATLLLVDAWFDVTTASSSSARLVAVVLAVVVEIPLAIFSGLLAHRAHQRLVDVAKLHT